MKKVSFKVAKAIKEAGYPQDNHTAIYLEDGSCIYTGGLLDTGSSIYYKIVSYIEVWLWLWQEKGIKLEVHHPIDLDKPNFFDEERVYCATGYDVAYADECEYANPEDAIVAAIDCLVENNLIK